MLLTLNSPSQNGIQGLHEHSRLRRSIPTQRSPSPSAPDHPAYTVPSRPADSSMASSRGSLPRPSSLNLPPPDVGFATMASTASNQPLPPPPAQWQGADDTMHHWLRAKAEEDRRKQEEEKTRQESLRLDQRIIEQSMLRDSLQAGIPPHVIPLIFAGIYQAGLPQPVLDLAQQYLAQLPGARGSNPHIPPPSHSHTHSRSNSYSQRPPMHGRQDSRSGPPSSYHPSPAQNVVPPPPNILLSQNLPPNSAPNTPQPLGGPSLPSGPPDPRTGSSHWMNSGGAVQAQSAPINLGNVQYAPGSSVPLAQVPRRPESQSHRSPPSLCFHHWVPPAQPHLGAAPGNAHQDSHQNSPGRKRKAPGHHQPAPVPSSRPSQSISGVSQSPRQGSPQSDRQQTGRLGHRHQPSDTSIYHENYPRQHIKAEQNESMTPSQVGPGRHMTSLQRSRNSTDQARSADAPYASSLETGARESDLESSPKQSPISGTPLASMQPAGASGR